MCILSVPTCPVIATKGAPSRLASATPVMRLVAPGPSVERQTPALPVSLPYTSAIKAAPCSWRVVINWIGESLKASRTCKFSSPGKPKTYSTPSFSRHCTSNSAVFSSPTISTLNLSSCVDIPESDKAKNS